MKSVAEIIGKVVEPVLQRRTGMTLDLIKAWPELVGQEFSHLTRPEKIDWPRRIHEEEPFQPATLVVACDGACALFFQHEQASILERINLFFGFEAVRRIKILQKPVRMNTPEPGSADQKHLSNDEKARLETILENIEDQELKAVLEKLGKGVLGN